MLRKIFALTILFGVAIAEPVARLSSSVPEDLDLDLINEPVQKFSSIEDSSNQQLQRLIPESSYVLLDLVSTLAGYKFTAVSLGVLVIEWLISNIVVIFIGAAAAVGLCKFTGKCNLDYESYFPAASLKNLVSPEYLQTAEQVLVSAVEKYAEKKARSLKKTPWF